MYKHQRKHAQKLKPHHHAGFSLVEAIIAVVVLGMALVSIYQLTQQLIRVGTLAQRKAVSAAIAQEQLEIIRNMPYDQVGSDTTFPSGPLLTTQTIVRDTKSYTVTLNINYVDDPADGVMCTGSNSPCDTAWLDYKKVEVQVCWDSISCGAPVRLTTIISGQGLENSTNTGALIITVLDVSGSPVSGATVTVSSPALSNNVVNATDVNGKLQLLSLPPATGNYHIVVTKSGYSSDSTYAPSPGFIPILPDQSILAGLPTPITFNIDQVSTLNISTLDQSTCGGVGSVDIHLQGQRRIGQSPDVYAFDQSITTDASGQIHLTNVSRDNYTMTINSGVYDVAGINPPDTIVVNPDSTVDATVTLVPHQSHSARLIVRDSGTKAPLADASVQVTDGAGYDVTVVTEQGAIHQSDWSGGGGQALVGDNTKYQSQSGGINTGSIVTLSTSTATHSFTEDFTTTDHRDAVQTTASWSVTPAEVILPEDTNVPGTYQLTAQAQSSKVNSTDGRITKVTLHAVTELNGQEITFAVSADGTTFEPITPDNELTLANSGNDLRWQAQLRTTDTAVTPRITSVSLSYEQVSVPLTTGTLTSSTFDSGTSTNYRTMSWAATTPTGVGADAIRLQVATNNDDTTWNYVGPDGTSSTFFTVSGSSLPASLSGKRYFRYKLFLSTDTQLAVPSVTSITTIKNNACTPPGQAFFSPLPAAGTYGITVNKSGYQSAVFSTDITGAFAQYLDLIPNP